MSTEVYEGRDVLTGQGTPHEGTRTVASSSSSSRDGGWAIPTIERARFDGTRKMSFSFARSANGLTAPTPVRAQVICGKLPRG